MSGDLPSTSSNSSKKIDQTTKKSSTKALAFCFQAEEREQFPCVKPYDPSVLHPELDQLFGKL